MLGFLYTVLIAVALLDLALVSPALRRATASETIGRLASTLLVLAGLALAGAARLANSIDLVMVGLVLINLGLFGYALWLPERGVRDLYRQARQR